MLNIYTNDFTRQRAILTLRIISRYHEYNKRLNFLFKNNKYSKTVINIKIRKVKSYQQSIFPSKKLKSI